MIKPILKDTRFFYVYFYHGVCSNNYFEYDIFYNFMIYDLCFMISLEFISFGYNLYQR